MKLSRYEQEVVINLNADEEEATVYTANPVWMRKMDKLHKEFPDIIRLKSWTEVSKTYVLPKNLVRIGKPKKFMEYIEKNYIETVWGIGYKWEK